MNPLDQMIAKARALGNLNAEIAKEAAPGVEAAVKKTAAAGTDPYGKAWAEKKAGGRAMPKAADHVTARAAGATIGIKLKGPDVFHNGASGKTEERRQVIPDGAGGIPDGVSKAITEAGARVFARIVGGG